ncbi:pilus assembly FimT family protein [Actomonas aquatica]|uniref:Prepilin-type N-terminal cleavage/methylation domain-containing protein n=1 Tax=Actomonas aquatica TaxID=2866162 RepID=A0ABZ1C8U7_9BACT|nr:prepilin-type N-terminal cleavage/methylation domain-containing protein [Opitutus sp. WL0086]WRQ88124.1 prepilin-type N-terminal cleavage/methylation domain-containing protein [Opitutus sp. WL0086]
MPTTPRASSAAYTLIELMVVIALIAVLTAAVGLGLRGAGETQALAATGDIVRAQFEAAQARASIQGAAVAVVVNADAADTENYLKQIAVAQQQASGAWVGVDDALQLPGRVRMLVPAEGNSLWQSEVDVQLEPGGVSIPCYLAEYGAAGALAVPGGGSVWWENEDGVRAGLHISRYGAFTVIEGGTPP